MRNIRESNISEPTNRMTLKMIVAKNKQITRIANEIIPFKSPIFPVISSDRGSRYFGFFEKYSVVE